MTSGGPTTCVSPLRWAGGKRKLLPVLKQLLPASIDRLVEPFFGGGSVSLGLPARSVIAADTNDELVNFFVQSGASASAVSALVSDMSDDRETYNRVRAWSPATSIERAARFAFLNRTGYFGLYRTNLRGQYNVPYGGGGRLNTATLHAQLHDLATVMPRITIEHTDYLTVLSSVEADDVVFLDPPYGSSGDFPFRRYGSLLFSRADHRRLAAEAVRCQSLGARVFLTLPPDETLLDAYDGWHVVAERWRGPKLAEICLTNVPGVADAPTVKREWTPTARIHSIDQATVLLESRTG